jgi:hypothetical protein
MARDPSTGGSPGADSAGAVNDTVADAVGLSVGLLRGGSALTARQAAHMVAAQAAALTIQDAAAHLRNVQAISAAARAAVLERIARDPGSAGSLAPLVEAAEAALRDAEAHVDRTGLTARRLHDRFDPGNPEPDEVQNDE